MRDPEASSYNIAEVEDRIFSFQDRYQEIAEPFEWKFTRADLEQLCARLKCNEGINEIWKVICGSDGAQYNNAATNLIVGTGSGAATATDTETTFTAGVKKTMMSGFPTYGTNQKVTFKSSYGPGDANQDWNEFGALNNAIDGKLLNRKVSSQGSKADGQTWELILEISLS